MIEQHKVNKVLILTELAEKKGGKVSCLKIFLVKKEGMHRYQEKKQNRIFRKG